MAIAVDEWLGLIRREYLQSYLPDGGSAVRFVVAPAEQVGDRVLHGLQQEAQASNLICVKIDAAATKLHMLQNIFFAVGREVDWDRVLQRRLELIVAESGYVWPEPGKRLGMPELAAANTVAKGLFQRQISQQLTRAVWDDAAMAQDFRSAMLFLLDTRLDDSRDTLRDGLIGWLTGRLRRLTEVKEARIGAKIGRHNARVMLKSLCHWLRSCEAPGMLILIDIRQLLKERRDIRDGIVYTPAAVLDVYEVLRQTIDDASELEGVFVAVLADGGLLDSGSRRSLDRYAALHMRVRNDVRPEQGDNPLAPLVELQ